MSCKIPTCCIFAVALLAIECPTGHGREPPTGAQARLPVPPLIDKQGTEYYEEKLRSGRFGMPSVEDIAAIKVSVYQSTSRRKDIEPFELPKSYYGKVLDYFGGFVIDHSPNLSLPEVGSILIRTKDGRIRRISWYGGAQAPIMFSLQGIRCIAHGGRIRRPSAEEAIDLDSLIREAAGAR